MKAIQFIKDHGLEKAREVVEGAIYPIFGYDPIGMNYIHKQCDIAPVRYSPNCNSWSEDYAIEVILIEDLNRLVESVDLITKVSGIENAKTFDEKCIYCVEHFTNLERLKQAIADYESIYGEEGASHE